jgi:hypothetical protein
MMTMSFSFCLLLHRNRRLPNWFHFLRLVLIIGLGLALWVDARGADQIEKPADAKPGPFYLGFTTHSAHGLGLPPLVGSLLQQEGVNSIRDEIYWQSVEKTPGHFVLPNVSSEFLDRSFAAKLDPLVILDYGNPLYSVVYPTTDAQIESFTRYCEFVVKSLKGKVRLYEIWNEWGGIPVATEEVGNPEQYVKLLAHLVPRLKAIDPHAIFMAGWLDADVCPGQSQDSWILRALKAGLLKSIDAYSYHPYTWTFPQTSKRTPEALFEKMTAFQKLLTDANAGKTFPVFVTEFNWPTDVGPLGLSEEKEANWIGQVLLFGRSFPWLKGFWIYDFQNDGWDPKDGEQNFGAVRADGTPKPLYDVVRTLASVVKEGTFLKRIDTGDEKVVVLSFKEPDDSDVWAIWSTHADAKAELTLTHTGPRTDPLLLCEAGREPVKRSWADSYSAENPNAEPPEKEISFTVGQTPWIIKGDMGAVQLAGVKLHEMSESQPAERNVLRLPGQMALADSFPDNTPQPPTPEIIASLVRAHESFEISNWEPFLADQMRPGDQEISARSRIFYKNSALCILLEVTDDIHDQKEQPENFWRGDSVQIGLQPLPPGSDNRSAEYTLALTLGGPEVYCDSALDQSPPGLTSDVTVSITRQNGKTYYYAEIPAKAFGVIRLAGGQFIGLSLLVNDNDGRGRKGALSWGGGIAEGKDPQQYRWVFLTK